jgi:hypothetical protein
MRTNHPKLLSATATTLCVLVAVAAFPFTAAADGASSTPSRAVSGAKLKADYRFEGNLKSSVSGAPRLRNVGIGNIFHRERVPGEGRTRVLRFPNGSGLKVHTSGLIPSKHYSVVMQFRLATAGTDVYARILNPTLPADDNDNGLYLYNDHLIWYDEGDVEGSLGTVAPAKYVEVAFTRKTTGKLRTYVNGQPDITYTETDNQAVIQNHLLRFFVDNSNDESSKGAVSRIRLYNDALTAKKVARIYSRGH